MWSDALDYIHLSVDEVWMQYITDDHDGKGALEFLDVWRHFRRSIILRRIRMDEFRHGLRSVSRTY